MKYEHLLIVKHLTAINHYTITTQSHIKPHLTPIKIIQKQSKQKPE